MPTAEFFTSEGCFITEVHNTPEDAAVSVARARVPPGTTTALHTVTVRERYLIEAGHGLMTVGDCPPFPVAPGTVVDIPPSVPQRIENIGPSDLVFLCVCTPRFTADGYQQLMPPRP